METLKMSRAKTLMEIGKARQVYLMAPHDTGRPIAVDMTKRAAQEYVSSFHPDCEFDVTTCPITKFVRFSFDGGWSAPA